MPPPLGVSNLEELEALARPLLSAAAYGYYASGSETESALRNNFAALQRYRLLPRVLVDVSRVDTSCELFGGWAWPGLVLQPLWTRTPLPQALLQPALQLGSGAALPAGQRLALPVLMAPMAMQRLCHPDGELAAARAAAAAGVPYVLSTMATASIEEVAATGLPGLWFQIYVLTRRDVTAALVKDAEALGYKALVVTVDAPRLGPCTASLAVPWRLGERWAVRRLGR